MRPFMQKRIDKLHAEIARIVATEKAWHDRKHPDENKLWRSVSHAQIEVAAWSPQQRKGAQLQGSTHE